MKTNAAGERYARYLGDIHTMLGFLTQELAAHEARQNQDARNWALTEDMKRVRETIKEALLVISPLTEDQIEDAVCEARE